MKHKKKNMSKASIMTSDISMLICPCTIDKVDKVKIMRKNLSFDGKCCYKIRGTNQSFPATLMNNKTFKKFNFSVPSLSENISATATAKLTCPILLQSNVQAIRREIRYIRTNYHL